MSLPTTKTALAETFYLSFRALEVSTYSLSRFWLHAFPAQAHCTEVPVVVLKLEREHL